MTIKLIKDDCLNAMKNIPDKSIDMILADLPYGITKAKWDSVIPLKPLWKQYKRIIKDHGAIALFGRNPFTANLVMSNLNMYRYNWIWQKTCPTGFLNAYKMPLKRYEDICIFYKHLPTYNPQFTYGHMAYTRRNYLQRGSGAFYNGKTHNVVTRNNGRRFPTNVLKFRNYDRPRSHPTQKPANLLRYLVRTYTNEHMNVLDNVMGSGSTGVACKQLNRNFIGIEKDTHYFNVANLRINKIEAGEAL